jgi:hypothetical protein
MKACISPPVAEQKGGVLSRKPAAELSPAMPAPTNGPPERVFSVLFTSFAAPMQYPSASSGQIQKPDPHVRRKELLFY